MGPLDGSFPWLTSLLHVVTVVIEESLFDLTQKLRDSVQVHLCRRNVDVPHVCAENRQQGVDIPTFSVPFKDFMDSIGMPQIVRPGAGSA
jgi:hypothetical protein